MIIRIEEEKDFDQIEQLIQLAFKEVEISDHQEHSLVQNLRLANLQVSELCLVAERKDEIVGHVFVSHLEIIYGATIFKTLALAPMAVLPKFQKQGVGTRLIKEVHKNADELGYGSIILLGHEDYYPKFGYKPASSYGLRLPFNVPDANFMAIELHKDALKDVEGMVTYPDAFFS